MITSPTQEWYAHAEYNNANQLARRFTEDKSVPFPTGIIKMETREELKEHVGKDAAWDDRKFEDFPAFSM